MKARKHPPELPTILQPIRRISSQQLLLGQRIIEIEHTGQHYTLRVTRENKLILTK